MPGDEKRSRAKTCFVLLLALMIIVAASSALVLLFIVGLNTLFELALPTQFPGSAPKRTVLESTLPISTTWTFDADAEIHRAPVVSDGFVLLRSQETLTAIGIESKKQIWTVPLPSKATPPSRVLAHNGVVAVGEFDDQMRVIDLATGKTLWTRSVGLLGGYIASILIGDDKIYVSADRGCSPLSALSLREGNLLWSTGRFSDGNCDGGDLELVGQDLYLIEGTSLYVVEASTGKIRRSIIGKFRGGGFQPLLGENLYWSIGGSVLDKDLPLLAAQSITTGKVNREFRGACSPMDNDPFEVDLIHGRLYASGGCHKLLALEPDTGRLIWRSSLAANGISRIVTLNDVAYIMLADGSIHAFDLESGEGRGDLKTSPEDVTAFLHAEGLDTDGKQLFATFGDRTLFVMGK